ncbi:DUF281 domain-containing protein [Caenorhabditis elegans]|uniref:DUF281 domain-containing protein n=1 Tax=Caenorhabditis elegans TaxID=6239 RepID=Q564T9_CAEEL|nr:DUF281 domain-containing protein [Caenorhabditis elegans]CAI79252.2 DUF281 domain-containing protein [Caenorhabditis elegans]
MSPETITFILLLSIPFTNGNGCQVVNKASTMTTATEEPTTNVETEKTDDGDMSAITQYGMVDPTTEGCSEYQAVCTRNGAICNPIRLKAITPTSTVSIGSDDPAISYAPITCQKDNTFSSGAT